jgi:glycosidase
MVPVEFWSYMNASIKMQNPDAFLLAEVYNPDMYRDYIRKGKMDYLYDKVALYDTIKHIMKGHGWTDHIIGIQKYKADIEHNMLHFLENHDEQRIASPDFAGSAEKGKPAMVVSATISTSPTMIYFGQEVGEPGAENAGFGSPTRTSIFDYVGVPTHQRWMNDGKFDGGESTIDESELRDFYKRLLNFTIKSEALMGEYKEIHSYNREKVNNYTRKLFSFVRWTKNEKLLIISNFDSLVNYDLDLQIPSEVIASWQLNDGTYLLEDQLYNKTSAKLIVKDGIGFTNIKLSTLESFIFKLKE